MSKIKQEYVERLNKVLNYIQVNVNEKISLKDLSEIANFSPFHFHRIFSAYIGESISNYVKRIKLDNSALKLKYTNEPIINIAFSCGYETASAYAKAFKHEFGKTPSEFRSQTNNNKMTKIEDEYNGFLKDLCVKSFKGIYELQDVKVLYVQRTGNYREIFDDAWNTLFEFAESNKIINDETKFLAICLDDPEITPVEKLRYQACITFNADVQPERDVEIKTIPGGLYAKFLHEGPYETLYQTYDAMLLHWMPENYDKIEIDYNILRDVPCFEILNKGFLNTKPEELKPRYIYQLIKRRKNRINETPTTIIVNRA